MWIDGLSLGLVIVVPVVRGERRFRLKRIAAHDT